MLWYLIMFADLFTSAMQFCRGYDVYRFDYGLFPNDYGAISYYAWSIYLIIPFVCVVFARSFWCCLFFPMSLFDG